MATATATKTKAKTLKFNFNPDLFNNVYWHLKAAFNNVLIRYIWLYGGSSASKTFSVVQLQIILMLEGKKENALVLRKFHVDIKDSIYTDFKGIIGDWGLTDYFIIQQDFIKCKLTGSYVRFRGLDDSEKIKGISRFKRILLEEISQFEELDFKQLRKRLRGMAGQQIIGIFNPISEDHWIKLNVFDKEELIKKEADIDGYWENASGNLVIFKTNYLDNIYITGKWRDGILVGGRVDQHVIDDFNWDKVNDYEYYWIYGLGNWGMIRTGGEFFRNFKPAVHVRPVKYDLERLMYVSIDSNVYPHIAITCWQLEKLDLGWTIRQVAELPAEDPENTASKAALKIVKYFKQIGYTQKVLLHGDKSTKNRNNIDDNKRSFFQIMNETLINNDFRTVDCMPSYMPAVPGVADFVNAIFEGNITGLRIEIGEHCKQSINDYVKTKTDKDGSMLKVRVKHPTIVGLTYEPWGHLSDTAKDFLVQAFHNEYISYINRHNAMVPGGVSQVARASTKRNLG